MNEMEENLIKLAEGTNPQLGNALRVISELQSKVSEQDETIENLISMLDEEGIDTSSVREVLNLDNSSPFK